MSKKTTPPTVITITLDPEGTGTLIIQRGDLAALHQFAYTDLRDVVKALQDGANQLLAVEDNPPPVNFPAPEPAVSRTPDETPAERDDDATDTVEVDHSDADTEQSVEVAHSAPAPQSVPLQQATLF